MRMKGLKFLLFGLCLLLTDCVSWSDKNDMPPEPRRNVMGGECIPFDLVKDDDIPPAIACPVVGAGETNEDADGETLRPHEQR